MRENWSTEEALFLKIYKLESRLMGFAFDINENSFLTLIKCIKLKKWSQRKVLAKENERKLQSILKIIHPILRHAGKTHSQAKNQSGWLTTAAEILLPILGSGS